MIGCIVTGHGGFAPGMMRAIEMIAGNQEYFKVIAFEEEEELESFEMKFQQAVEELLEDTSGVLIFSDLLGGTPFRSSMLTASQYENVEVLTGSNLPMLIEIGLLRQFEDDVQALARQAVETGKQGIQNPQLDLNCKEIECFDEVEGI